MDFVSMSMPETPRNIEAIRKMAKSKDYNLKKVRNQDLFTLQDLQSGHIVISNAPLWEIHQFLCNSND